MMKRKNRWKGLFCLLLAVAVLACAVPAYGAGASIKIDQEVSGVLKHMNSMAEYTLSDMYVSEYFKLRLVITASSDEPYEVMLFEYDDYGNVQGEKYINSSTPDKGVTVNGRTLTYESSLNKYAIDTYHWVISVPEYQWFEGEDEPPSNLELSYTFMLYADTSEPFMLFWDVIHGDWYYDCVKYVVDNGLFTGASDTLFLPDNAMTRSMLVTVLGRSAGVVTGTYSGYSNFSDVSSGAYYTPYVNWAYEHDIIGGTGGGKFSPDAAISRQDMVTIIYRFIENPQLGNVRTLSEYNTFSDKGSVSSYADDAMKWAFTNGIIGGVSDTRLDPRGTATRAQVAQIFMNANTYGIL